MVKRRLDGLRIAAIAATFVLAVGATPRRVDEEKDLPRFQQVNENLYRGAQPLDGGLKDLAARGIKTIINLRGEDESTSTEEAEARAAGFNYFSVPLPGFGRPSTEQVEGILAIINDSRNWPVFVHCKHGKDRTGTIIACYRISHDHWTAKEALKEAKRYGMSWMQFGMKDFIRDYYRDYAGAAAPGKAALQTN